MKVTKYFVFMLSVLFGSFAFSEDKVIKEVISQNRQMCRNNSPHNCIKPINIKDSKVKALEIKINGTESFSMTTYDKYGKPVDLENKYQFKVTGTRVPPTLDVSIEPVNSVKKVEKVEANASSSKEKK